MLRWHCVPSQVATPRVRTAAKADIPHVDDHVKMLAGLGNQTQQKLMDINAAAAAVGVFGLQLPHNTVTKGVASFPKVLPTTIMMIKSHRLSSVSRTARLCILS